MILPWVHQEIPNVKANINETIKIDKQTLENDNCTLNKIEVVDNIVETKTGNINQTIKTANSVENKMIGKYIKKNIYKSQHLKVIIWSKNRENILLLT